MKVKYLVNESDKENIDLFAWFPETMEAYGHIGQHTGVVMEYIHASRKATKQEYESLHHELISIGYKNLLIIK